MPQLPDLNQLIQFLQQYYASWGYAFTALGAFMENTAILGLFFPGGTMILLGAFYAKLGVLSFPAVWLLGALGTMAGASLDFWAGRLGVYKLLFRLMPGSQKLEKGMDGAHAFMEKWGLPSIFLAHFVGHVRSFVAVSAGTCSLPYRKFLLYEGIAALAWSAMYCVGGYIMADNLGLLQQIYTQFGIALAILVIIALAAHFGLQYFRRRKHGAEFAGGYASTALYARAISAVWRMMPFSRTTQAAEPGEQETK
jgi:membrane protein DedA with SNARE-associated domain